MGKVKNYYWDQLMLRQEMEEDIIPQEVAQYLDTMERQEVGFGPVVATPPENKLNSAIPGVFARIDPITDYVTLEIPLDRLAAGITLILTNGTLSEVQPTKMSPIVEREPEKLSPIPQVTFFIGENSPPRILEDGTTLTYKKPFP